MNWLLIHLWLLCLVAFVVGAVIAWLVVRALYRPIREVSAELSADLKERVA